MIERARSRIGEWRWLHSAPPEFSFPEILRKERLRVNVRYASHVGRMPVARRRNPGIGDAFDLARLGAEAWMVIGLRMAKLAAGGPAGLLEAQRMTAEKAGAALEAQLAAGMALASGATAAAAGRKALKGYRRRVKANRRRLYRRR